VAKLVRSRAEKGLPIRNPMEVLETFCAQEKLERNFLYDGLSSADLRRKMKKKFDNIVADARRKCRSAVPHNKPTPNENHNAMNTEGPNAAQLLCDDDSNDPNSHFGNALSPLFSSEYESPPLWGKSLKRRIRKASKEKGKCDENQE
jgi:hypothetical protein